MLRPPIAPRVAITPLGLHKAILMNTLVSEKLPFDTEYIILENIYNSARQQLPLRQRDLAQIAGASLGMTNSILKRLSQKGWIAVKKLNSRNIQYAITLDGINEIARRSYRYFKRTIKNVVYYKDILEDEINRARSRKISRVVLVGSSDLDFIVEHACRRQGINFSRIPGDGKTAKLPLPGTFKIYSENFTDTALPADRAGVFLDSPKMGSDAVNSAANTYYLSRLIFKQAADSGSPEINAREN